jgi:hypothetical protein
MSKTASQDYQAGREPRFSDESMNGNLWASREMC